MGYIKSALKGGSNLSFYSFISRGLISLLILSLFACVGGGSGGGSGARSINIALPLAVIPDTDGATVSWSYPFEDFESNRTVYEITIGWEAVPTNDNSTNRVFYLDGDSISYEDDLCPSVNSENNTDVDGDGIGDVCDPDFGLPLSFVPEDRAVLIRWATTNDAVTDEFRIGHRRVGEARHNLLVNATDDRIDRKSNSYTYFLYNGSLDEGLENGVNYEISVSRIYTDGTEELVGTRMVIVGPNYDGDPLADSVDLDDDNDGILDSEEVEDPYFDYSKLSALGDSIVLPSYDSNDPFLVSIYNSLNASYSIRGLPSHSSYVFTVDVKAVRLLEGFTQRDYYDQNPNTDTIDFVSDSTTIKYRSGVVVVGENMDGDEMADSMDGDDDNDGVGDSVDLCDDSSSEMNWESNPQTDRDGDGCRDFSPQQSDRYVLFSQDDGAVYVAWKNPFRAEMLTSADLLFFPLDVDTSALNESSRSAALHLRVQANAAVPFVCQAVLRQNCHGTAFGLESYRRAGRRAQVSVPQLTELEARNYQAMVILHYGNDRVYFTPESYTFDSLRQGVQVNIRNGLFFVEWTNDVGTYDFFVITIVNEYGDVVDEAVVGGSSLPDSATQPVSFEVGARNMYHFPPSVVLEPGLYTVELEGVTLDNTNQQLVEYFDFPDIVDVSPASYPQEDDMEMRYDPSSFTLADIPLFYFHSEFDKKCARESILYVLSTGEADSAACGQGPDRVFWASTASHESGTIVQVEFPPDELVYLTSLVLDATTNFFFNSSLNQLEAEYRDSDDDWILLSQFSVNSTRAISQVFFVNDYASSYRLKTRIYEEQKLVIQNEEDVSAIDSLTIRVKEFRPNDLSFTDIELATTIANTNDEDKASFDDGGVSYVFYDGDRDGVNTDEDNCPTIANPDQANLDFEVEETRMDLPILGDACDYQDDRDADGDQVPNYRDNCPAVSNPTQSNEDEREEGLDNLPLLGDACDDEDNRDFDSDGIDNYADNCILVYNRNQTDSLDNDGIGDACDMTDNRDSDGDGLENYLDNCPYIVNPAQLDADRDGIGDVCDDVNNYDVDGDSVSNEDDNCPMDVNPAQADRDDDGIGDECDLLNDKDFDEDTVPNAEDNCPHTTNREQWRDRDGDGAGDACDPVDDRMALFTETERLPSYYAPDSSDSKLILGDQSGGGSAGAFRRLGRDAGGLDEAAIGGNGGGGDDNVQGTRGSDILFGDGSGGGAGARFSYPGSSRPRDEQVSNPGGRAGAGDDSIQGNEGDDILFGDGYHGSPSEGRDSQSLGNRHCGYRGPCNGGDGGYGGGGGGGANVRQPFYGSGMGGMFMSEGGKGGLGAGNGGDVYYELVWGVDSQAIQGFYFCSQWNEEPNSRCRFIGRAGASSPLDESYRGGRGTIYDSWISSHHNDRLDCFFGGESVRVSDCHASGGGGAGIGADGGAGIATSDESTWAAAGRGHSGSNLPVEFEIDREFWEAVLEDINFDGQADDPRVWGEAAQGVGNGDDEINGGRGNDIIITGGGQDVIVLDLTSNVFGSNDFDVDRVLDFNMGNSQCNRDRIKIRRHADGSDVREPGNIREEVVTGGFSDREGILTFTGSDRFGSYIAVVVRDGLKRADNTHRLAALFLYDHHLDTDGIRDRDSTPNDLRPCHLQL